MPEFLVYERDRQPKVFRFDERVSIGRDQAATLVLPDRTVSRLHAVVNRHDTQFILVDKGARNRNLVNGQPVRRIVLRTGDEIQIGRYLLVFHADGTVESEALPAWPPTGQGDETTSTVAVSETQLQDMRSLLALQDRARLAVFPSASATPEGTLLGTRTWTLGGPGAGIPGHGTFAERWPAGVLTWNGRAHVIERESRLVRLRINGTSVSRMVVLELGDIVEIGNSRYRYELDSSEPTLPSMSG